MRKTLIVLIGAAGLLGPAAGAEPLVRLHTSYYYIDGRSAAVLAAQLDQKGPLGSDGRHHPGSTRWDIQWKLHSEQQGTSCTMQDVAVAVGIAQTLPRWRGESKGAATLKARWSAFNSALQRHLERHKQNAMQAASEVEAALRAVKPASNCEDLEAAANAAAQAIVARHQDLDEQYDRKTGYGRGEGASLL
jgi:predicted secreted Zn-dependent protease